MIEELRSELTQVNQAIIGLEQLAQGQGKGRGRPPAWMKEAEADAPKKRGRPPGKKNQDKLER